MLLSERVAQIADTMSRLPPGPLAALRRMDPAGPGTAAFWQLASRGGLLDAEPEPWMRLVRIMAILVPPGEPGQRPPLHNPKRGLGTVLCDGGDPGWPETGQSQPVVSETRLAHLLAQRPEQRRRTLERVARMLAQPPGLKAGVNCTDLAVLVLTRNNGNQLARLAQSYYRRLDSARRKNTEQEATA